MRIFVDADGSPVVKLSEKIAIENNLELIIVKNYAHQIYSDYGQVVSVDVTNDSADYYIVNRVVENDIVVTQDYGLASLCLLKNAIPISQNGLVFTKDNIDGLLDRRFIHAKLRSQGKSHQNAKKRTKRDDENFIIGLTSIIKKTLIWVFLFVHWFSNNFKTSIFSIIIKDYISIVIS